MNTNRRNIFMSKVQTITDKLRDMISNGYFADNKIPGERELAVMFNCSRITVRAVLARFEEEGKIKRCRKKGTMIVGKNSFESKSSVALIMPGEGHFYKDIYREILNVFIKNDYSLNCISTHSIFRNVYKLSEKNASAMEKAIAKVLQNEPDVYICNTYKYSEIPHFEELLNRNTILFGNHISKTFSSNVHGVWFDYEEAGYIGGRYLLEKGCRKPVYFPHFFPFSFRFVPAEYNVHREKMLIDGFRRAMIEGGINPDNAVINSFASTINDHRKVLVSLSLLNKSIMPDGFMASDAMVIKFMKCLQENQGCIPDDTVFVGLYNTPWSRGEGIREFSSIDFMPEKIAESILKMVETPINEREDISVTPKLVTRT